eukprot:CAMPEP_0197906272 /NCGR_PEP_ID=MMETSP1439-20131203/62223_1 /TAXON_ID=66791 /ORGANISM="Gonyaulax spinifera, Strain CCMP409" /LENGTH=109 /DNA_ID=CAMNT_0043527609 /DNA_START=323 /DNA_END=653 /DNA_ORIENTATION=-
MSCRTSESRREDPWHVVLLWAEVAVGLASLFLTWLSRPFFHRFLARVLLLILRWAFTFLSGLLRHNIQQVPGHELELMQLVDHGRHVLVGVHAHRGHAPLVEGIVRVNL